MEATGPTWGRVYGLEVQVGPGVELPGVPLRRSGAPSSEATAVVAVDGQAIEARWPRTGSVREREVRHPEGDLLLAIDRHSTAGYLIDAPHHGRFLVAPDGREVLCAGRPDNEAGAQSVLLGQVLPLAATVAGREILHAGAVALNGRAVVIAGPTGRGKSNLVARLVLVEASLIADDAVAVSENRGIPITHPGPSLVHLIPADADRLADGRRLVPVKGFRAAKVAMSAQRAPETVELGVVYLLDRGGETTGVAICDASAGTRSLLGSAGVMAVRTGERLIRHMEICGRIAERVPVRTIAVGTASQDEVAAAVRADLEAL